MSRIVEKDGFTLIEMMLVSAIVGLLAAIAIPKFANLIHKAREASAKGILGALRSALSIYYVDNEGFYPRYGLPFSMELGACVLDGKYIDLDKLRFPSLSHLGPDHFVNATAKQRFCQPSGYQYRELGPPAKIMVYSPDDPFPCYASWSRTSWETTSLADFRLSCFHLDTKGKVWSDQ